jgi:hypothetical protein
VLQQLVSQQEGALTTNVIQGAQEITSQQSISNNKINTTKRIRARELKK